MSPYRDESKRFQVRDSPLTRALRNSSSARGTYSGLIALSSLFLMRILALYILDPDVRRADMELLQRFLNDFHHFFFAWMMLMLGFTLIGCSAAKIRVTLNLSCLIYYPVVVTYILASFAFVMIHSWSTRLHTALALGLGLEHVRMLMKMISFVVENERKLQGPLIDCNSNQSTPEPPTFRSFLYFMFAPTLIYRDRYPLSEKPFNHRSFMTWTFQVVCTALVVLHLASQVGIPSAKYVGLEPITGGILVRLSSWSFVGGVLIYLISVGYASLHCWCNAFAEILRFGDREFYGNWWSVPNMFEFFGKWNYIVQTWLSEYIYKPTIRLTGNRSVTVATVFLISGIFHDYIMSVTTRFYFSIWTLATFILIPCFLLVIRFTSPQRSRNHYRAAPRFPMTTAAANGTSFRQQERCDDDDEEKCAPPLNIMSFLTFFSFLVFFSFSNAAEYFAHENCPPYGDAWYWLIIPRFPTCIKWQLWQMTDEITSQRLQIPAVV